MKKLLMLLLAAMLLLGCARAEMADVVITLPGQQVAFTPLAGGVCLTRESSASAFNKAGLSQREVLPYMEEYDLYAMLFDAEYTLEMQLCLYEGGVADYTGLDAFAVSALCDEYEAWYAGYGYEVRSVDTLQHDGYDYVRMRAAYVYEDGVEEYMLFYATVRGGYAVELVVFPSEGPVTAEIEAAAEAVLTSLRYVPMSLDVLPAGYAALVQGDCQAFYALPEGLTLQQEDNAQLLIPAEGAWQIRISAQRGQNGDLDVLAPEMAKLYCENERKLRETVAERVSAVSLYESGVRRYLRTEAVERGQDSGMLYVDEYFTKQDGWDVTIAAVCVNAELTVEARTALQEIVDSMMIRVMPVTE